MDYLCHLFLNKGKTLATLTQSGKEAFFMQELKVYKSGWEITSAKSLNREIDILPIENSSLPVELPFFKIITAIWYS